MFSISSRILYILLRSSEVMRDILEDIRLGGWPFFFPPKHSPSDSMG